MNTIGLDHNNHKKILQVIHERCMMSLNLHFRHVLKSASTIPTVNPFKRSWLPSFKGHFPGSGSLLRLAIVCIFLTTAMDAFAGIHDVQIHEINGKTMGTFYHIKVSYPGKIDRVILKNKIDARLQAVNNSMSMYLKNSEISRFNRSPARTPMVISDGFVQVLKQARVLYDLTGGAWDGTVKPLVDLWGFGTVRTTGKMPSIASIHKALENMGFDKIILLKNTLAKEKATIALDMSSIAKGYGVDQVARLLRENQFENTLVEIGGEVVGSGEKRAGIPWNVGIATPDKEIDKQTVYQAIALKNKALATSGDYRNFVVLNKKDYSHIIDPSTGYPVKNGVVSASVLADTCTRADGLATALMVMGPRKGISLVNRMAETECLIIVQKANGSLVNHYSSGFPGKPQ